MDITNRVEKFVDCRSKDVSQREVYIVEGDSALGSCKLARDPMFQAIMPIRGKILNCLKADYPRIFKSDIITDLVKVLGAVWRLSLLIIKILKVLILTICVGTRLSSVQMLTLTASKSERLFLQ